MLLAISRYCFMRRLKHTILRNTDFFFFFNGVVLLKINVAKSWYGGISLLGE